MKEATGELNMTVVAIIIIAALGALVMGILNSDAIKTAITDRFTKEVSRTEY